MRTVAILILTATTASLAVAQDKKPAPTEGASAQAAPFTPTLSAERNDSLRLPPLQLSVRSCASISQPSVGETDLQLAERQFALGMQILNADKPSCAIRMFDAVLAKFPFAAGVLANRALANAQLGDWEKAEADADRAIALDGSTAVAFNARGLAAAQRGDHDVAIAAFTRSIELVPNDRYAHAQRMRSYYLTGKTDAAYADANWLIGVDPRPHNVEVAAKLMADIGRRDDALVMVDRAISAAKGAERAALLCIRAHLLVRFDRRIEAVASFDQAIKLAATPATYLARAETRAPFDRPGAMKDVESARRLAPYSSDVVRIHAWLLTEMGEAAEAVTLIDQALTKSPGDIMLYGARAYAHEKLGQIDAMLDDLDEARRTDPDDMNVAAGACFAKARVARRLDSARSDCDAALAANPYKVSVLKSRGLLMLKTDSAANAALDYALARHIDPTDGDARFGYGVALLRLQQTAAGNAELATAQKLSANVAERFAGYGVRPTQ